MRRCGERVGARLGDVVSRRMVDCDDWGYTGLFYFFFFNDTATTEIYTLSLHDALPISTHLGDARVVLEDQADFAFDILFLDAYSSDAVPVRSEEHTSELQSPVPISYAVFCLKKKKILIIR